MTNTSYTLTFVKLYSMCCIFTPMEEKTEFPRLNLIRSVLAKQGRSQRWLSDELGISHIAINNICTQKSQPSLARLFDIARILGVSITDIINVDYKSEKE